MNDMKNKKTIVELFAGVGGFRLGFERLNSGWETVWFSQWEPEKKQQWAFDCYVKHFGNCKDLKGEYHTNDDISIVNKNNIPTHTLLVGGFPCQDYSVAHTLGSSRGIEGKKGVLWWSIRDTIIAKKPKYCIFENVDRLLKSPASQRGRDFGVILFCLNELNYSVEWRVVNAATYGAGQKRKRTFIFAYRNDIKYGKIMDKKDNATILSKDGFMAKSFPIVDYKNINSIVLNDNILDISDNFKFNFKNAGYMHNGVIYTCDISEKEEKPVTLNEIQEDNVDEKYFIPESKIEKWKYLKGSKKIMRTSKDGHEYLYSEGSIAFPDALNKPARTMLTSEGSLNRCSHIIEDKDNHKLRILTPVEAERIQGFDDNWTKETISGSMPLKMRYFCMGNALVVPMITRMGKTLDEIIDKY